MSESQPNDPQNISVQKPNENDLTDVTQKSGHWSTLLSKYSTVWIWSIITGLNSSLFFSFFNARWNNYGIMNAMLIAFNLCAITFSLMAWFELYRVLRMVILPTVLDYQNIDENIEEQKLQLKKIAYHAISRSFYYTMLAVALKSFTFLIEGAFNALSK